MNRWITNLEIRGITKMKITKSFDNNNYKWKNIELTTEDGDEHFIKIRLDGEKKKK